MNTTKHTPGPWKYAHGSTDLLVHDGDDVAYVDTLIPERPKEEQQANARLIAAAPELLEALEAIKRMPAGLPPTHARMKLLRFMVDAAIAKATGTI